MEFCEFWNAGYKEPLTPLSEAEAKARHEAGETYTVLGPDASNPTVALEVTLSGHVVKVYFLDDLRRVFGQYVFAQPDGPRLFLEQTYLSSFTPGDEWGDHPVAVESTSAKADGTCHRQQGEHPYAVKTTSTIDGPDLTERWEPLPEWGDWSGFARLDRSKPCPDPTAFRL